MRNKKFFFIALTDFAYLCVLISKETITITHIMKEYNDTNLDDDVEEYYTHLQPDTLLQKGKYRIIRFIKSGGFGCTYEAVNTTWQDRRVAIKELYIDDFCHRRPQDGRVTITTQNKKPLFEKLRKKFWDEANRINQLTHPGVVRVTDFFEENGTVYYVMDYIEGNSLHDLIAKNGALSEAKALYYIRQVAEALQYVHEAGLMHLDIKPGNIMVSDKDKAILIDFGVSRQYDEVSNAHTSTLVPYTEGFAPIEQMGRNVREFGAATDIYALGATLYALLTGESPLSATILASGEKLPALPSKISATTRRAVLSAMSINKDNRPQSVAEFLALLDGKKTGGGRSGGSKPKSDKPFPWPLVALAGVVLGVAAIIGNKGDDTQVDDLQVDATETERIVDEVKSNHDTKKEGNGLDIFPTLSYDEMVYVEGGEFMMGSQSTNSSSAYYDYEAGSDESPVHKVTLSSYYIGKYEVTQQLWEYVMNYSGATTDGTIFSPVASDPWLGDYNPTSSYGKGDYYPAYYVSYDDIVNHFLPRLNKITGKTYRLPTEAEWEYAARGGNKSQGCKYSGSHSIDRVAWYDGNSGNKTHAVATKQANELGLYDMSGNVWEWCSGWYGSYSSSSQTNPKGASSGQYRVSRGGSWSDYARYCRVSNRDHFTPSDRYYDLGFRVVLVP